MNNKEIYRYFEQYHNELSMGEDVSAAATLSEFIHSIKMQGLELCSMDELLKILCAATARIMAENQAPYADIKENISGDGMTFTINIKAAYTEVENG